MLQLFLWALMWHTVAPQCSSLTGPQVSPQCNSLTLILPQLALQHFDPPSRLSPISQWDRNLVHFLDIATFAYSLHTTSPLIQSDYYLCNTAFSISLISMHFWTNTRRSTWNRSHHCSHILHAIRLSGGLSSLRQCHMQVGSTHRLENNKFDATNSAHSIGTTHRSMNIQREFALWDFWGLKWAS